MPWIKNPRHFNTCGNATCTTLKMWYFYATQYKH